MSLYSHQGQFNLLSLCASDWNCSAREILASQRNDTVVGWEHSSVGRVGSCLACTKPWLDPQQCRKAASGMAQHLESGSRRLSSSRLLSATSDPVLKQSIWYQLINPNKEVPSFLSVHTSELIRCQYSTGPDQLFMKIQCMDYFPSLMAQE